MSALENSKITEGHLGRQALIYIRQSSQRQVEQHIESGRMQYALVERAKSLGWAEPVIIDEDMGKSAGYDSERSGFQRVVTQVGMGSVGLVLSLEATRLARNNRDWYHLIDLCTLFDTVIGDHQALYDPKDPNDRLLLGVKGTMSEAELNLIKFRMRQGRLSKARRGALHTKLPPGYLLNIDGQVEKTPDLREQEMIALIFAKFLEFGSGMAAHQWFVDERIAVPVTVKGSLRNRNLRWLVPKYSFIRQFLRNPFYAGAYAYGKSGTRVRYEDGVIKKSGGHHKPRKDWEVLIRDHHEGYITWEQYEENLRIMEGNTNKDRAEEQVSAVRNGRGLLVGLMRCRRCGRKMHVRYWGKRGTSPRYVCPGEFYNGGSYCQSFSAEKTDRVFVQELFKALEPVAVRAAIAASQDLHRLSQEKFAILERELEQADYEARRAEVQYQQVDPLNRLVAAELERRWNEKLSIQQEVRARLEKEMRETRPPTPEQILEVQALSDRLPEVWQDPKTDPVTKKRIIRLLVNEVLFLLDEKTPMITMTIHWKGGVHSQVEFKKPVRGETSTKTNENIVDLLGKLAPWYPDEDIARIFNCHRLKTGNGNPWNRVRVRSLRSSLKMKPFDRIPKGDVLSLNEAAKHLGVGSNIVRTLIGKGVIQAQQIIKHAPFMIPRAELEKEAVKRAMRQLKKGGSAKAIGVVSNEQLEFSQ